MRWSGSWHLRSLCLQRTSWEPPLGRLQVRGQRWVEHNSWNPWKSPAGQRLEAQCTGDPTCQQWTPAQPEASCQAAKFLGSQASQGQSVCWMDLDRDKCSVQDCRRPLSTCQHVPVHLHMTGTTVVDRFPLVNMFLSTCSCYLDCKWHVMHIWDSFPIKWNSTSDCEWTKAYGTWIVWDMADQRREQSPTRTCLSSSLMQG